MSPSWTRIDERPDDPRVVRQLHEHGCGAACAVMLLADRHHTTDPLEVAEALRLPCTGRELAERLSQMAAPPHRWLGGVLDVPIHERSEALRAISATGSWACLLVPPGRRHGHWVVVAGLSPLGVAVLHPAGSSYTLPHHDFDVLTRHLVAVFDAWTPP